MTIYIPWNLHTVLLCFFYGTGYGISHIICFRRLVWFIYPYIYIFSVIVFIDVIGNRKTAPVPVQWYRNIRKESIFISPHKTQQVGIVSILPEMHSLYCITWCHWDAFYTGFWNESIEHLHHAPSNCIIAQVRGNDPACYYPYQEFNNRCS